MLLETVVGLASTAVVTLVGWAINTNADIKVVKQKQVDQDKLVEVQLGSIDNRLDRIERALNGAWKRAGESNVN